jgi:hypothetical protein
MLVPQKFLVQLLIAAAAFGSVGCPCPALAASEVSSHAQHQSQTQPHAPSEACQHSECVSDCGLISAGSSEEDAITCNGKYGFDDFAAIPPEFIAAYQPERLAARANPPPHVWVSRDTPVRRFDRLLD